jgi:L-alanine-DL-glutamate epimerase-like enolase superfamily enzyme
VDSEGYIAMPEAPGMGLDLDWGYINRNRV